MVPTGSGVAGEARSGDGRLTSPVPSLYRIPSDGLSFCPLRSLGAVRDSRGLGTCSLLAA